MSQNTSYRIGFKFWLNIDKPNQLEIADTIELLKNERSFTQTIRDGIRLVCDLRNGKLDVLFELFPWVRAEFMEYMRDLQLPVPIQAEVVPAPQIVEPTAQQTHADRVWLESEQERIEAERKWHEKRMQDAEKALVAEREKIEQERSQTQNAIQQQLERLEQLLIQQGNQPIPQRLQPIAGGAGGNPARNSSGLQALNVPNFSAPTYDDEDDDLIMDVQKPVSSGNATQNFLRSMQALQQ